MTPARVLFVCTHNSARSQMAEALLRARGDSRFEAHSAGTEATRVHPLAITAMRERDLVSSAQRSKTTEEYRGQRFDYVVTVCNHAQETCPYFPDAGQRVHWDLPDPSAAEGTDEQRPAMFRSVRDEIERRIAEAFDA